MKKTLALLVFSLFALTASAQKNTYVKITTDYGSCVIKLYNETPLHRNNFIKLAKEGFYNDLLFHRIISTFMIQGGDPNSKDASDGQALGSGDVGYTIPAEFNEKLFHKRGALAAARDNNPEKASSGCQFYIVQGKRFTLKELENAEQRAGFKFDDARKDVYITQGGAPHLDMSYTVFGEVVEGMEMVDRIAALDKLPSDRSLTNVKMQVEVLKKYKEKRK